MACRELTETKLTSSELNADSKLSKIYSRVRVEEVGEELAEEHRHRPDTASTNARSSVSGRRGGVRGPLMDMDVVEDRTGCWPQCAVLRVPRRPPPCPLLHTVSWGPNGCDARTNYAPALLLPSLLPSWRSPEGLVLPNVSSSILSGTDSISKSHSQLESFSVSKRPIALGVVRCGATSGME